MLPITGCAVLVRMNPSSVVNTVLTVTRISTTGLNSTAQVRVTSDPKGGMGLGMLLDSAIEVGSGTANNYDRNGISNYLTIFISIQMILLQWP